MPPRPQRTPSEVIIPGVLRAALALISEQGPEGLTVRALARRADVAPMSIYNHFGGKNGVLDAIIVDGFSLLAAMADTSAPDPRDNLVVGSGAYRDFALAYRAHYTVMFLHQFVGYSPSADTMYVAAKGFEILAGQVQRCVDAGMFAGRSNVDTAQQIWAAVHGYVALEILGINFASDRERVFYDFLDALINGLDADAL
ncbi:MAG: TetR/AcrR family transcriptional regulator [Actinomycetota bacterium]|jgi:AcrR family transcriptional regulator|nr:TetR/AcrR family transcriptional regulator [Actinomycetota bacterium]